MFVYEKKLQYPVKIKNTNPKLAAVIISQYGGPDGELGAKLVKEAVPDARLLPDPSNTTATVDLLIGNSYCKYIARAENIPFVRFGFPVLDRMSHCLFPTVGYNGALRLLDAGLCRARPHVVGGAYHLAALGEL